MAEVGFSPAQARALDITGLVLLVAALAMGLLYQLKGWKLEGSHLIGVCIIIITYVNLFRAQIAKASARIDALEQRVSALAPR